MSLSTMPALFEIDGQSINVGTPQDAISGVMERLQQPSSFMVCTLNLDHLIKLRSDPDFKAAYRKAEFVTADGFPIVMFARLDAVSITRTTGSDLIAPLCRAAAEKRVPIFLFGTTLPALCGAARVLVRENPSLDIRGVFAPPQGFKPISQLADEAIALIAASEAKLCFVALGAPSQEIFSARALERTSGIGFLAVGGGLDFIAGMQRRCPIILQRLNLEWAWRLCTDPLRLGGRYFRCAVLFTLLLGRRVFSDRRPSISDTGQRG